MTLCACATQSEAAPQIVDHAFTFDARVDSPDTLILQFKYGVGGSPQTQGPFWKDEDVVRQGTNINGYMPLGDSLYVKWRIKSTGQVYEDSVNLKGLLPHDMHQHRVTFIASGSQLSIFLVEPSPRPPNWPIAGPRKFQYEKVRQIYPVSQN
jgi:hypothetical protein